jgi:hypothetical protein
VIFKENLGNLEIVMITCGSLKIVALKFPENLGKLEKSMRTS